MKKIHGMTMSPAMTIMTKLAAKGRAEAARLSGRPDYRSTVDMLDEMADALDEAVDHMAWVGDVMLRYLEHSAVVGRKNKKRR